MSSLLRKATAFLLLGGYLLSVTVGGAFHTHGPQEACCSGDDPAPVTHHHGAHDHPCHAAHDHTGHVHCAPRETDDNRSHEPSVGGVIVAVDGTCAICSFLAQKPIPNQIVSRAAAAQLPQSLERVRAIARIEEPLSSISNRGPPTIA